MYGYTKIDPTVEIEGAGDNILYRTSQGVLLVFVRDMDDICRKINFPVVRVPGLKGNLLSSVAAAQKDVKTVITVW